MIEDCKIILPANVKFVGGFRSLALRAIGADAICWPWKVIWIDEDSNGVVEIISHEMAHIRQINVDGPWQWTFNYLWWLMRWGYWWHPYEISARISTREFEPREYHWSHHTLGPVIKRHNRIEYELWRAKNANGQEEKC